jgi:hypothetical protein
MVSLREGVGKDDVMASYRGGGVNENRGRASKCGSSYLHLDTLSFGECRHYRTKFNPWKRDLEDPLCSVSCRRWASRGSSLNRS